MKLINIISGLKEKKCQTLTSRSAEFIVNCQECADNKIHNQLCNREVEVDYTSFDHVVFNLITKKKKYKQLLDYEVDIRFLFEEALSIAISQGKVLKVKE